MTKYPLETQQQILEYKQQGRSGRQIAKMLGLAKSSVNHFLADELSADNLPVREGANVLFLDLEVAPSVTLAFSRFKAFATPDHVLQEPYILTSCAKWQHEPDVMEFSIHHDEYALREQDDGYVVEAMWDLLDRADVIVGHNTERFDNGWLNNQFVNHGFPPPSPFKTVDTLKILKKSFSLPSNSLDAACQFFGLDRKKSHNGIELWKRCMRGDVDAFEEMLSYNHQDVLILEQLFDKIYPFAKNIPNMALYYDDNKTRCPHCGSTALTECTKPSYTTISSFKSFRCDDCGKVSRNRVAIKRSNLTKTIH